MSANPPLRLLAIDPGLAHVGIAIVNVTGMHQVEIDRGWTVHTSPKLDFLRRLDVALTDILAAVEGTEEGFASWYAVIEDPRGVIQNHGDRRKDPRRIADLVAAFGAIVAAVGAAGRVTAVELVPVVRWYPRAGRGLMKHADVLQRIRVRHPELAGSSEHVCMALGLADWWSVQIAPRLWFELQRQPSTKVAV